MYLDLVEILEVVFALLTATVSFVILLLNLNLSFRHVLGCKIQKVLMAYFQEAHRLEGMEHPLPASAIKNWSPMLGCKRQHMNAIFID